MLGDPLLRGRVVLDLRLVEVCEERAALRRVAVRLVDPEGADAALSERDAPRGELGLGPHVRLGVREGDLEAVRLADGLLVLEVEFAVRVVLVRSESSSTRVQAASYAALRSAIERMSELHFRFRERVEFRDEAAVPSFLVGESPAAERLLVQRGEFRLDRSPAEQLPAVHGVPARVPVLAIDGPLTLREVKVSASGWVASRRGSADRGGLDDFAWHRLEEVLGAAVSKRFRLA